LSTLALFLAGLLLLVAVVALTGPNKQILITVYILYPTIVVCLVLNRFGHIHLACVILTLAIVGGMCFTLTMTAYVHGGLTPNDKDILYLPFFGELVVAALLPSVEYLSVGLRTVRSQHDYRSGQWAKTLGGGHARSDQFSGGWQSRSRRTPVFRQ
jgi:hypothetical protein